MSWWDTSNVLFDGGRVLRYDKGAPSPDMRYIDYGLELLSRGVLACESGEQPFELPDLYARLARDDQLAGFEVTRRHGGACRAERLISNYTKDVLRGGGGGCRINQQAVDAMVDILRDVRERGGRLLSSGWWRGLSCEPRGQ